MGARASSFVWPVDARSVSTWAWVHNVDTVTRPVKRRGPMSALVETVDNVSVGEGKTVKDGWSRKRAEARRFRFRFDRRKKRMTRIGLFVDFDVVR